MSGIIDLLFDHDDYADAFGGDLDSFFRHMYNICVSAIS